MCGHGDAEAGDVRCGCHGRRGDKFLEAWLLLLLKAKPSHGYDLVERLGEVLGGVGFPDPGTVYRNLRRMEEEGLVSSSWSIQDAGPPRRSYRLTEQGEELLGAWASNVEHYRGRLTRFLELYERVSRSSPPGPSPGEGAGEGNH